MATMNGTAAADNLVGTTSDDILNGLGGNDTLNGGGGNDQIFGDVTSAITAPIFNYNGKFYLLSNAGTWTQAQAQAVALGGNLVTVNDAAENQFLVNTFGLEALWIGLTDEVTEGTFKWANGEAVTYTNWSPGEPNDAGGAQDYAYINFQNPGKWDDAGIAGIRGIIEIASNDTIIGSTGNDTINGGIGQDTADYSAIGQAITLKPTGVVTKGTAGTDQLVGIENIIGATGLTNIIDASTATGTATINANLATKSLVVNTGDSAFPTLSFSVHNFVNVIGTANNDTITGNDGNNNLAGGNGNDTLNGGEGNDQIFGDVTSAITAPIFNYNGKFYLLSNAGTWTQAQAQAVTLGGNLVTVNDAAENQFLVNTFGSSEALWIGLTDEVTEGTFKWANGEAVTYTNWSPGQPDNANNEDYVEFNFGGAGIWNDLPNSSLLPGIIEIANSNDTIIGSTGDDTINGGLGSDTVNYSSLTEAITLLAGGIVNKGSFGTDTIVDVETVIGATGQSNTIDASTGIATTTSLNVNLATNNLIINGLPAPINSITLNVQNFLNVVGTTQNDTIKGNNLANELVGNTGNDTIQGNDGNDILDGGDGNDQLFGGLGNDILQGDNGNDFLNGDLGNDTLRGLAGDDILDGGVGNDSLLGGVGNDILFGDFGDDILNAEAGNDLVFGDDGNDRLYGGDGSDELNGGIGKDFLYGGNNNDTLFGNDDNDTLWGEAGNDILNGGKGNDILVGGTNNDIFVIALSNGADIVQDFQDGLDRIGLSGGLLFSQLTILGTGTNTVIRNTSSGEIFATLQNVSSTLITSVDFTVV
ncbi:lectin-like protein [Dolichospermum planctonicum]|uniref:Hemolysin-type calcium-binding region protein n=1 Tax=Dolichospermum planctonicum TaxID=136072 RepID=A0A480AFT4_9CYAN|nr:lectin-like protein [Dolichospermum planctonicum]GCL43887.1 hemolysin-type calcium-binding region protein [Dolichospermum planctonicum]